MQPVQLMRSYVDLQNQCVAEGDFSRLLVLFHPDAELQFEGVSFGPFRGWEKIREALETGGPTQPLDVLDVAWSGERALATYAWRRRPGAPAGTITLVSRDGLILRLVIGLME